MPIFATTLSGGHTIPHTPGADVAAGAVVVVGGRAYPAPIPIASGALGHLSADQAEVRVEKNTSTAFEIGDPVFWDASDLEANDLAYDVFIGVCIVAAGASDTTVDVRLVQAPQNANALPRPAKVTINFGDTSPIVVARIPAGHQVLKSDNTVVTAFTGGGATVPVIKYGYVGVLDALGANNDVNLKVSGSYPLHHNLQRATATDIIATFDFDGATAGQIIVNMPVT